MPQHTHAEFLLGDTLVRYQAADDSPDVLGLVLLPRDRAGAVCTPREHLEAPEMRGLPAAWQPVRAWEIDPLVHVQLQGEPYPGGFGQGRSMRHGPATLAFRVREQRRIVSENSTTIRTVVAAESGLVAIHELKHVSGETALRLRTTIANDSTEPRTLELLTSFSLGGLTPFASDDAPGQLWVHRFRSAWSAEARHEARRVEELHLERSWIGHGVRAERFGQIGSMPTNGFFPFVALEDRAAGVCWGARIAHPGSWQLEIFRRADHIAISGGLADREFGHWWKRLLPGETFTAPEAWLATTAGGCDDLCDRLRSPLRSALASQPDAERALPIAFNEWCTSWGNPNHERVVALADRLRGTGVRYLVIDDGWAERPGAGVQQNGDWIVDPAKFPDGLRATTDAIRDRGLVPGIWFEIESVNPGSRAWHETSHQLHRDGAPLQVGRRRFWDFRDPWVHAFLAERVITLLRENGFGYLKIDYNDTIGLGCDGAESPGEGLRQHLAGVQDFIHRVRAELPELVIENCASGGHRAEPSMMALTSMTSFSDAHELPEIPVLAGNVNRLILPAQSQIWAVLRKDDSPARLSYSLAAAFLGRMCLSGDVHALSHASWSLVLRAIASYRALAATIAEGTFRRYGPEQTFLRRPAGWQAVICHAPSRREAFMVWHAFADAPERVAMPLPQDCIWSGARELLGAPIQVEITNHELVLRLPGPWTGGVLHLDVSGSP